jgi:hypothetical protein
MPAVIVGTVRAATASMALDAPEERPDLWPGFDGDEVAESPVGGTELLEEVVVTLNLTSSCLLPRLV